MQLIDGKQFDVEDEDIRLLRQLVFVSFFLNQL